MILDSIEEIRQRINEHCGIVDADITEDHLWDKLEGINYKPGSKIKIEWQKEYDGIEDIGYILTLPCPDYDDVYMAGIVHIPFPQGSSDEPVWIHIVDLIDNPYTKKISLCE